MVSIQYRALCGIEEQISTETAESIFRRAVAQAISRFVSDDSLKTVGNFICYLDLEVKESESNEIRCGRVSQAEELNELWQGFRFRLKMKDLDQASQLGIAATIGLPVNVVSSWTASGQFTAALRGASPDWTVLTPTAF